MQAYYCAITVSFVHCLFYILKTLPNYQEEGNSEEGSQTSVFSTFFFDQGNYQRM